MFAQQARCSPTITLFFLIAGRCADSATLENSYTTGELTLHDGTTFKGFSFRAETSMVCVSKLSAQQEEPRVLQPSF
jgi:hypothetical protein